MNKINSVRVFRKFTINFAQSCEFRHDRGVILLFSNLLLFSSSSCFFDEAMEALGKPPLVRGPLFLTGNVGGVIVILSTYSSNDDSVKESEGNPSNSKSLPENMPSIRYFEVFFDMYWH